MANPRFLTQRCINDATLSANPALLSTKPETFLQTQDRNDTARSTSTASQEIKLSWSSAQRINMVALGFHNFSTAATWTIVLYSDAAWTTTISTPISGATLFGHTGLSSINKVTDREFRIYRNAAAYFTLQTTVQSMKITFADASNPDGYFDFSRLMVGEYFELSYQFPYGGLLMYESADTGQSGAGSGSVVSDKRANYQMADLTHDFLTQTTDQEPLEALHNYCGMDRDFFFSAFPADGTINELRKQGFFKFQKPEAVDRNRPLLLRHKISLRGM